jgi:hypothetical protein
VRLAARRAIVQGATAGVIPPTLPLTPPLNKRTTRSNCHCPTIERRRDDLHYSETAEKTLPLRCTETKFVTTAHKPCRYGQRVSACPKRHQIVEESPKNRNSSSTFNNLRKPRPGNQGKSNGRASSPRVTRECRKQHDEQPELRNPTIWDSPPGAWRPTGLVNRQYPAGLGQEPADTSAKDQYPIRSSLTSLPTQRSTYRMGAGRNTRAIHAGWMAGHL